MRSFASRCRIRNPCGWIAPWGEIQDNSFLSNKWLLQQVYLPHSLRSVPYYFNSPWKRISHRLCKQRELAGRLISQKSCQGDTNEEKKRNSSARPRLRSIPSSQRLREEQKTIEASRAGKLKQGELEGARSKKKDFFFRCGVHLFCMKTMTATTTTPRRRN